MQTPNIVARFTRSASGSPRRVHFNEDERYEEKKNNNNKRWESTPKRSSHGQAYMNRTFLGKRPLAAVLFIFATFFAVLVVRSYSTAPVHSHTVHNGPTAKYMQLIIPINRKSDTDLCKTVLSAQVLNYPVPVIVPWGNSTDGTLVAKKQRMHHKATQIYSYLNSLPREADDGIAILLDGPDTWFQLRPESLLQGYYRITSRRNRKLQKSHGKGFEQKVVFSASDVCGMSDENDPSCSVIPQAPATNLPNYLGHGAIVGQVQDVRKVLARVIDKLETQQEEPPSRLLPIFTHIFGEQEARRQQYRIIKPHQKHNRRPRQVPEAATSPPPNAFNTTNEAVELGIGLDYHNELGFSISPTTLPQWHQQTSSSQSAEIQSSMPPYWTVSGQEPNLPHHKTWSEIPLFTTSSSNNNSIPAMLHHYPTVAMGGHDATGHRTQWWSEMWFTEFSRALYTASERLPSSIVAQVRVDNDDDENERRENVFWNLWPSHNRAGAWLSEGKFWHWQDMCGLEGQWREVFRDEEGPWVRREWF